MTLLDILLLRKRTIHKKFDKSSFSSPYSSMVMETRERLNLLETFETVLAQEANKNQSDNFNLMEGSLVYSKTLFNMDRCESLLENYEQRSDKSPKKDFTKSFLYPNIREVLLYRVISVLIKIRGWIFKYETKFESTRLSEYIYLKSPFLLEPVLRLILFKKRMR